MPKTPRQLDREINEVLSGHSGHSRSPAVTSGEHDLNETLRHYARLADTASDEIEAWEAVASRIEAGVKALGLRGDSRTHALDRARDARSNAQFLKLQAQDRFRGPQPQGRARAQGRAHARVKSAKGTSKGTSKLPDTSKHTEALNRALRDYAKLSEASSMQSPGHSPAVWDEVAARLEAGVEAVDLEGDYRTFALDRARSARSNARWMKIHETRNRR